MDENNSDSEDKVEEMDISDQGKFKSYQKKNPDTKHPGNLNTITKYPNNRNRGEKETQVKKNHRKYF